MSDALDNDLIAHTPRTSHTKRDRSEQSSDCNLHDFTAKKLKSNEEKTEQKDNEVLLSQEKENAAADEAAVVTSDCLPSQESTTSLIAQNGCCMTEDELRLSRQHIMKMCTRKMPLYMVSDLQESGCFMSEFKCPCCFRHISSRNAVALQKCLHVYCVNCAVQLCNNAWKAMRTTGILRAYQLKCPTCRATMSTSRFVISSKMHPHYFNRMMSIFY